VRMKKDEKGSDRSSGRFREIKERKRNRMPLLKQALFWNRLRWSVKESKQTVGSLRKAFHSPWTSGAVEKGEN